MSKINQIKESVLGAKIVAATKYVEPSEMLKLLEHNICDFGDAEDFHELLESYRWLCKRCGISLNFSKEVEEIKENIVEMLDNPYYNML